MAVGDELDFTPPPTMSTIQTSNDVANVVINSLLIVFILININSAVSKLIHLTQNATFSYESWLRSFIFASSDDPLRILSWVLRKYVYRESDWRRYPNKRRLRRLFLPLLARILVLIVSMISIAITIPQDKVLSGCASGDYKIVLNETNADPRVTVNSICTEIPLKSSRGIPNATASYCACPNEINIPSPPLGSAGVATDVASAEAWSITTYVKDKGSGIWFYVEWKRGDVPNKSYRSELSTVINKQKLHDLVSAWFEEDNPNCLVAQRFSTNHTQWDCTEDVDVELTSNRIVSRLTSAIEWNPTDDIQRRSERSDFVDNSASSKTTECPVPIIVSRPIVNMVPLAIMLAVWIAINVAISAYASRRNNALDAGFHIVKEALGHDTTSNPIETCTERDEITKLKLRKWRCGGGGTHVGFIGRAGDVPVEKFDDIVVVCGCAVVGTEFERARVLLTASPRFVDPSRSPGISGANM